jgi:hypothetical protein
MSSPHAQDLLHAQARGHLRPIKQAYRDVHGLRCDEPFNDDAFLAPLKVFLAAHPMRSGTKEQVALHEAGHFVGFEACGLIAGTAEIHGSTFGRYGWGGVAKPWNSPAYLWPQDLVPDDFLGDARAALAGPVAEELLADGDALSSIGELADAALRSDRAAELSGRDDIEMWNETLLGAVALVERHRPEILDIAEVLGRKKRISRTDRAVEKILARVPQGPIDTRALSPRGPALARKITDGLKELAR